MGKGTPSFGKRARKTLHIHCRRCGRRAYHVTKKRCSACGYGETSKRRRHSWQTRNFAKARIR